MRSLLLGLGLLFGVCGWAHAQTGYAYACASPIGQAWYFPNQLNPANAERFVSDGIRNGRMLIMVGEGNGPGGADVRYRDASESFRSVTAEGGEVGLTHIDTVADIARIDVSYQMTGTTKTFLLYGFSSGRIRLVYTQIRPTGATPKVAVFTANCERF